MLRRLREELFPRPDAFDRRLGVKTAGTKSAFLQRLFTGKDYRRYQPVDEGWFHDAVKDVPRLPFIDMGCGRGRALILAHEAGFEKLTGVEFSSSLCRVARRNLAKVGIDAPVLCQDANDFVVPDSPCVLLFCNPFGEQTMNSILSRIGTGHFLIYIVPQHENLFSRFRLLRSGDHCRVFAT